MKKLLIFPLIFIIFFSGCAKSTKKITVTLSISCEKMVDNISQVEPETAKIVPENGIILSEQTYEIPEKSTVLDAIITATKKEKIALNFQGNGKTAYIMGINGIEEFSCGQTSGWIYRVNGEFPGTGVGSFLVKPDDKIELLFTTKSDDYPVS